MREAEIAPALTLAKYELREIEMKDAGDLLRLYGDPRTTEFLPLRLASTHDAETVIAGYVDCWKARGYGLWSVRDRDAEKMVGRCGFLYYGDHDEVVPEYELAYMFEPDVWGHGLATACAKACLDFAFRVRGFDNIFAKTNEKNIGSWRVMENVGMERVGLSKFNELHKVFYVLSKAQFTSEAAT